MIKKVYIDDFPEAKELSATDQIIAFRKNSNGQFTPVVFDVESFRDLFIVESDLEELSSSLQQLSAEYKKFEDNMYENYYTPKQASSKFTTEKKIDTELAKVEKVADFNKSLEGKADKEFLEYQYNSILGKLQKLKSILMGGSKGEWEATKDESGYPMKTLMAWIAMRANSGEDF